MKNALRNKIYNAFLACILIFLCQCAIAGDPLTPDATVAEFYKWYVHSTNNDHYPIQDDRAKLSAFVSKALIKEIDRGAGEDADYFTKSQDDFPDWENNISVKATKINGNTATVVVAIGATKESYRRLSVALRKEAQVWKIRKVRSLQRDLP